MKRLLKFEFRKLFQNPLFYIFFGAIVALVAIQALTYMFMNDYVKPVIDGMADPGQQDPNLILGALVIDPTTFYKTSLVQSSCVMILGIFTALIVLLDNGGPVKNVIARGYTRAQVYLSKYVVSAFVAFTYTVLILAISYPLTELTIGKIEYLPHNFMLMLVGQVFAVMALHSMFCMFSALVSNTVLAVFVNAIGLNIVTLILSFIDVAAKLEEVTVASFWVDGLLTVFAGSPTTTEMVIAFVMSAVYIAAGIVLGMTISKKKQF